MMSITVRLWSDEDLRKIENGEDNFMATVFLNRHTFEGSREISVYYSIPRKIYTVELEEKDGESYPEYIQAVDDESAVRFIKEEYDLDEFPLIYLAEETTTYREVDLKQYLDEKHRVSKLGI